MVPEVSNREVIPASERKVHLVLKDFPANYREFQSVSSHQAQVNGRPLNQGAALDPFSRGRL